MLFYIVLGILLVSIILLAIIKLHNSSDYIGKKVIEKILGKQDPNEYVDSKEFMEKMYRENFYNDYIDPYTKDYDGYQELREDDSFDIDDE